MKKIQVTTVTKNANVQVIELNAYIISKVIRAQIQLENLLRNTISAKQEYKVVDEEGHKQWVDVLDENGNTIPQYSSVDSEMLHNNIMPLINELVNAFEE
jgi:hypothetical protein